MGHDHECNDIMGFRGYMKKYATQSLKDSLVAKINFAHQLLFFICTTTPRGHKSINMGHKILTVKLFALCLVVSSCLATVYGSSCYQCASGEGADSCATKIDKGEAPKCPGSQPHCMKISGKVGGEEMILRSCAEMSWETILGSKDTCMKSKEVPNFTFKLAGRDRHLDDGVVCICSSDKCNPAGRLVPGISHIAIFLSVLFFGKMFV